jgi:hypothetical protein
LDWSVIAYALAPNPPTSTALAKTVVITFICYGLLDLLLRLS